MLPFLKAKQAGIAGTIQKFREPDQKEAQEEQDEPSEEHMAIAHDVMRAVKADDTKELAKALKAAFEIMDAEPHIEGKHIEPHSYDAQNQIAAKKD